MSLKFEEEIRKYQIELTQNAETYAQDCSLFTRDISGVAFPKTQSQVQTIVKIANSTKTQLYPISGGRNWGYGSSLPVKNDCWIVSLEEMNKIISFDEQSCSIQIEPGVTQGQLEKYFKERNINVMIPNSGVGSRGTIIGNLLDRGFGMAPIQDHASSLLSVSCVLGDGSIYNSFFKEMSGGIDHAYKWGIGPHLDGLCSQSNFSIITDATIKLVPKAEVTEVLLVNLPDSASLFRVLTVCQNLNRKLRGQFESFKIYDSPQIKNSFGGKERFLGTKNPNRLLSAVLYSNKKQIRSLKSIIKAELREIGIKKIFFISPTKIKYFKYLKKTLKLEGLFNTLNGLFSLASGDSSPSGLNLLYPNLLKDELDKKIPAIDGKNIIWYVPVIKLDSNLEERVSEIRKIASKVKLDYLSLTISSLNDSAVAVTVPLIFQESEKENVYQLYRDLLKAGSEKGFFPYRVPVEFMEDIVKYHPEYWNQVKKIKEAFDPDNIISPGRYSLI